MINNYNDELWMPVYGYEGHYEISNMGRVKSIQREYKSELTGTQIKLDEVIMRPVYNIDRYLCINLYKNGAVKQVKIHRLVALHFIPNPENKKEVNHKFGDKEDNRAVSLQWVTRSENEAHARRYGLKKMTEAWRAKTSAALSGGKNPSAKLVLNTENGVYFDTIKEAAISIGLEVGTLKAMLSNKNRNRTSLILA